MRQSPILRFVCSGALALAALAGAIPDADAAVYRGRFTPDYGAPFPDLYWNGTLEVNAPDSCIPNGPGTVTLLTCAGLKITDANVNLYNKTAYHNNNAVAPLISLDFDAEGWSGLNWSLSFGANKKLLGATSTAFSVLSGGSFAETMYNGSPAFFSLQFLGDFAQLFWFENEPSDLELFALTQLGLCSSNGKNVIPPFGTYPGNTCGWSDPDNISKQGAFITFELVPEPASLALVPSALAAMGLAGLWTKRRRRQPATNT